MREEEVETRVRRRSPNGAAQPYFDKSKSRWYQVVSVDGRRKKVSAVTRDEVVTIADELKADLVAGRRVIGDSRRTVGHLLDYWITEVEPGRVSWATLDAYRRAIELYLKPLLGDIRLTALDFEDVERMQTAMLTRKDPRPLSRQTALQARKVLSAALKWAVKKGWVASSAVTYADMPPHNADPYEARYLNAEEFEILREQLSTDRLECAYLLCCYLGLRRGEVLGLVWSDIDFDRRQVRIARQVRRKYSKEALANGTHWELTLTRLKTDSSRRVLRLPGCAVEALVAHSARQAVEREKAASWAQQPREGELVFTSLGRWGTRGGSMVDPDMFGRRLIWHGEAAGLGHVTPHCLRHTGVSLLYAQGVPMKSISEWAGHASESITSDVYVHLTRDKRDEVADHMDAAISRRSGVSSGANPRVIVEETD